jgi:hypothetical protein
MLHLAISFARRRFALGVALAALAAPPTSLAQDDTTFSAHATLRGWEEQVRLAVFDRGGSFHGRTSDLGILQRFNEQMDGEYSLDVISSMFSLSEIYSWYQQNDGVRFWAGSIDHLQLVRYGDFKADVALGANWSANTQFIHDQSLTTKRNLVWLGFAKTLGDGVYRAFLQATLNAEKPETDIEAGLMWKPGHTTLTMAFAALDVFSDVVYQSLKVDPAIADTALDYLAHPFSGRIALSTPLGRRFRAEAYGLLMTPTTVVVESQTQTGDGFQQDERYGYAGGLLEWGPSRRSAVGSFATWVSASLDRRPLTNGRPEDAFDLTEATWSVGLFAIHQFDPHLSFEGWLARVWRSEDRIRPDTTVAANVDYEDRTWAGRNSLIYRTTRGFQAVLGLDFTSRWTSGPAPVPTLEPLNQDNARLRADIGWSFGHALFVAGANLDVDHFRFDGAHGRFALYW